MLCAAPMNIRLPRLALSTSLVVAFAAGCSSGGASDPFGPDPDFDSAAARFEKPTGTLSKGNAPGVFGSFDKQKQDADGASVLGTPDVGASSDESDGAIQTRAIRLLDEDGFEGSSCQALLRKETSGTCACPGGGSFSYDVGSLASLQESTGPFDARMRIRFAQCTSDRMSIDGRFFLRVEGDREGKRVVSDSVRMLMAIDALVTKGAETHDVDLLMKIAKGELWLSVQVDDGWVNVRASRKDDGSGVLYVEAKNGSYRCERRADGRGTCVGTGAAASSDSIEF